MPSQIVAGNWEKRGTIYSQNDDESFRDAIAVIGAPEAGDGLVMEYFDSRRSASAAVTRRLRPISR